jgi:serine/threonine protein kinase
MERALVCPQCNAPLPTPNRFARSVVCSYCGTTVQFDESSVSGERFHKAFRTWNSPDSYGIAPWISIGESYWAVQKCIASGDIADVYTGQRARWPTELVIIKLLRDRKDLAQFDNEWEVLQRLQRSEAPGSDTFTILLPQPVIHGDITAGLHAGQRANIFRWTSGFYHSFEEVRRTYPEGIPPIASIWIWRRILEVLAFIHNSGIVHGAILPSHLLVQENEHGVKLIGYSAAGQPGQKLQGVSQHYAFIYPEAFRSHSSLTPQLDIIMSARCIVEILGGNPETESLPNTVPARLARFVQKIALVQPIGSTDLNAWALREELGAIANDTFGSPQFIPIVMPP